jgi:phage gpG-like protein
MAEVKFINLDVVLKNLREVFKDTPKNKQMLGEIGLFALDRIYRSTKSGKSLALNGQKNPSLSPGYINWRKTYDGPKGEFFSPTRSNLTLTGQLLNSLMLKILPDRGAVTVSPTGNRDDGEMTNQDLAKKLKNEGRPFLGMDETGQQRIKKLVLDEIRRQKKRKGFK